MKNIPRNQVLHGKALRLYFKDTFLIMFSLIALLMMGFAVACAVNPRNPWILLLPLMALLSPLLYIKMAVFYFRARKDIKGNKITAKTVNLENIVYDKRRNLLNRGGAVAGTPKYILCTADGAEKYTLCTANDRISALKNCTVDILYTSNTYMIVSFRYNGEEMLIR